MINDFVGSIVVAGTLEQKLMQLLLQSGGISGIDGFLDGDGRGTGDDLIQLGQDLFAVNKGDFLVGDGNLTHIVAAKFGIRPK